MSIEVADIAFTACAVTDLARARKFYEGFLGMKPTQVLAFEDGQGWIEYEYPGGTLALSNAWPPAPQSSTNVTFEVPNLDAVVAELKSASIPLTFGPLETPVCRMAGIVDPDVNSITFHQRKTKS